MKELFFVVFLSFLSFILNGQTSGWLYDLTFAQKIAQSNNKLILIDFWATWCGPCKKMDQEVWSQSEIAAIKDNFIPVKIDVDNEKSLAMEYNVRSIPMLILMDYKGQVIHSYIGYNGKTNLVNFISAIPADVSGLYGPLTNYDPKKVDYPSSKTLGLALQSLSTKTSYDPLVRAFLIQSDQCFKKCKKLAQKDADLQEAELLGLLNHTLRGNQKKTIKEITDNPKNYSAAETLMFFVLSKAYKKNGDTENYNINLSKLQSKDDGADYVAMLK